MVLFAGAVALLRMTWGRSGSVAASVPIPLIAFLSGVCNSVGNRGVGELYSAAVVGQVGGCGQQFCVYAVGEGGRFDDGWV